MNHNAKNLYKGLVMLSCIGVLILGAYFLMIRDIIYETRRNRSQRTNSPLTAIEEQRLRASLPIAEQEMLNNSSSFTLYSLFPDEKMSMAADTNDYRLKKKPHFHDYIVLGKTQIKDEKERSDLLAALYKGIGECDHGLDKCFNPRHGIHVVHEKKTLDLVICFQCEQIEVHDEKGNWTIPVSASPKPVFDRTLLQAGVRLPGK